MKFSLDSFLLLTLIGLAIGFWFWKKQDEFARVYAQQICKQQGLQFLDIARKKSYPNFKFGISWYAHYQFGFSSDAESRYEGYIELSNLRLAKRHLPAYRIPEPPANPTDYRPKQF